MTRTYFDCRDMKGEIDCTVAIAADSPEELLEAAVQHAISVHKYEDSSDLRAQLLQGMKNGTPPLEHG